MPPAIFREPAVVAKRLLIPVLWLFLQYCSYGALSIPIVVKEAVGTGATNYPVTSVVPLPYGVFQNIADFRLEDAAGLPVPSQLHVLNRWHNRDNSIRHVQVDYQATVDPYTSPGSGETRYYLTTNGSHSVTSRLQVVESSNLITVITGPLKITVNKGSNFNIINEAWLDINHDELFDTNERIILSSSRNGASMVDRNQLVQRDTDRNDIVVSVEEAGPMRVVIKAQADTLYTSPVDQQPANHTHGFAVRLYAYKDKPYIKIDYQLQNSAMRNHSGVYQVYSWPLYFEALQMDFGLNLEDNPAVHMGKADDSFFSSQRNNGLLLAQEHHNKAGIYSFTTNLEPTEIYHADIAVSNEFYGFMDVCDGTRGVAATVRHFWQRWPNGLKIDSSNSLSIQLFPDWSCQFQHGPTGGINYTYPMEFTQTGLYWLEDMQHVCKETLLLFHDTNTTLSSIQNVAKTFAYPPVGLPPTSWYRDTHVTLDLDGVMATNLVDTYTQHPDDTSRLPAYTSYQYDTNSVHYVFNWDFFKVDPKRKCFPGDYGGWPPSVSGAILSGNPADVYHAEDTAMGELNVFPQWLTGYNFERDYAALALSANPYGGFSWRSYGGNGKPWTDQPYLADTQPDVKPRDDAHAWSYDMEEAYYLTGNPWIRDWYEFIKEYRKTAMLRLDLYPDTATRAAGHPLAQMMQAVRVTGDTNAMQYAHTFVTNYLRTSQLPHGSINAKDSAFQQGFLARALISYLDELDQTSQPYAEAFQFLSGIMAFNRYYANFSYYIEPLNGDVGSSSGSGGELVDPQAWYYWNTGLQTYLNQIDEYVTNGINGGVKAYYHYSTPWSSGTEKLFFKGRYNQYAHETVRPDGMPPDTIADLSLSLVSNQLKAQWTAPTNTDLQRYYLVYSDKPIQTTQTLDPSYINWWNAAVHAITNHPRPGMQESVTVDIAESKPYYAAIYSFDSNNNMSSPSAVVTTPSHLLTVQCVGKGSIFSDDGRINCDDTGAARYLDNATVLLRAAGGLGSEFVGWDGSFSAATSIIQFVISSNMNLSAHFNARTNTYVLVDFGATADDNTFCSELPSWNQVLKGVYDQNVATGPGGITITTGSNGYYDHQGVTGSSRNFVQGETIVATWYNASTGSLSIAPKISFVDANSRHLEPYTDLYGTNITIWHNMTDAITLNESVTSCPVTIPAGGSGRTMYTINACSTGIWDVVNVNVYNGTAGLIVCDGIELITTDIDADHLPDDFELTYSGSTTGLIATADQDGDGTSNLSEFIAGTVPDDPQSVFQWVEVSDAELPMVGTCLSWLSVSGKVYNIHISTNLVNGFDHILLEQIEACPPLNTITTEVAAPFTAFRLQVLE